MSEVLKVEVESTVGMSVQTIDGDWVKQSTRACAHLSGMPNPDTLKATLDFLTLEAYSQCSTQIELVVAKTNADIAKGVKNG